MMAAGLAIIALQTLCALTAADFEVTKLYIKPTVLNIQATRSWYIQEDIAEVLIKPRVFVKPTVVNAIRMRLYVLENITEFIEDGEYVILTRAIRPVVTHYSWTLYDPCPFHVCAKRTDAHSEFPTVDSYSLRSGQYGYEWIVPDFTAPQLRSIYPTLQPSVLLPSLPLPPLPQPSLPLPSLPQLSSPDTDSKRAVLFSADCALLQATRKDFHAVSIWNKELTSNKDLIFIDSQLIGLIIILVIYLDYNFIRYFRLIEQPSFQFKKVTTLALRQSCLFEILLLLISITPIHSLRIFPPGQYIAPLHGNAAFTCTCSLDDACGRSINWFLNGTTAVNSSNLIADIEHFQDLSTLTLRSISIMYNSSLIQCAFGTEGHMRESSDFSILLLQGRLSTVKNLSCVIQNSTVQLTWTAPFSLDMLGIHPDIEGYRVNSSSTITTEFSLDIHSNEQCFSTDFIVAAINTVGVGEDSTVSCSLDLNRPELVEGCVILNVEEGHVCTLNMSDPVCDASLTYTDNRNTKSEVLRNITIEENIMTFRGDDLKPNQHYNCMLSANNSAGSSMTPFDLSTFDILNATILAEEDNTVAIRVQYNEDSEAYGALLSFVFLMDGNVDFNRSALLALDRQNFNSTFDLYPGFCEIFIYDIERNETLSTGIQYPAVITNLTTTGNGQGKAVERCHECRIANYYDVISVYNCSGLFQSRGIEMVARSSILNKIDRLYVNQSTNLELPVTLRVESNGMYEVTLWPIGAFDRMCSEQVMVMDIDSTISISANTMSANTMSANTMSANTELPTNHTELSVAIGVVGILLSTTVLLIVILIFFIVVARRCCMKRKKGD